MSKPRVVLLRGHESNPWDLGAWASLRDRYDIAALITRRNRYDVSSLAIEQRPVTTLRDLLPKGAVAELAAGVVGDRYLKLRQALEGAAIVHAAEIGSWFTPAIARLKAALGYRLVLTVWETIPLGEAYRPKRVHEGRAAALAATDLYITPTTRSRDALVLEGVDPDRIVVSAPGIDVAAFRRHVVSADAVDDHVIVSPGRLVWEKGHQDVIRALAAIDRGLLGAGRSTPRLLIIGRGPEKERLRAHAEELGVGDRVEIRSVLYTEMPAVYARASCMVLASLPRAFTGPGISDMPRNYWEEQFGMVLAEAMAAGVPIVAASSGAIPEVTKGDVSLFPPGDWRELARLLVEEPLSRPAGARVDYDNELIQSYSLEAAAERIGAAYERVLELPLSSLTQSS